MSRTPDAFFRGNTVCNVCAKELKVNDTAITYHVYSKKINDLIFCSPCATKMTMSVAQDISNTTPEDAFVGYRQFKDPTVSLERHAAALEQLANQMKEWSECLKLANASYGKAAAER